MTGIYLSPSVQEFDPYLTGGNEEFYMNRITDAMIPYLRSGGIRFTRNNPGDTLSQVTSQSNAGDYDLHLALHSASAPENLRGALRGPDVYFFTTSAAGKQAAEIFVKNLKKIYPDPNLVMAIPTTTMTELKQTRAPAILIEIAYHDNYADSAWIRDNVEAIAKNLAKSAAEYLKVPFSD